MARLLALAAACLLALGLPGCVGEQADSGAKRGRTDAGGEPATAGGTCPRPPRTGTFELAFRSAGARRTALVHVPARADGRRLALVLGFHGAGGTGALAQLAYGLDAIAEREGFIVVYPTAARNRFWALNRRRRPDDLPIVRDLLAESRHRLCVDPRRIYATGVSNGGGFAARVGCEIAAVAAIAPVAGGYGYPALQRCRPRRPVSVLEIHGTADRVVPYAGKPPRFGGNVPRFLRGWARRNGCAPRPTRRRLGPLVERLRWSGCAQGGAVEHLRLGRTGHTWPGGPPFASDPTGVDARAEVWRFLAAHTLPPRRDPSRQAERAGIARRPPG